MFILGSTWTQHKLPALRLGEKHIFSVFSIAKALQLAAEKQEGKLFTTLHFLKFSKISLKLLSLLLFSPGRLNEFLQTPLCNEFQTSLFTLFLVFLSH